MNLPPKHAYAVLAHTDKMCLSVLLNLIDDPRNDVYVLLDKKADPELEEGLSCRYSNLHILPKEKRVDVRWGDISFVKAELSLFEHILQSGINYSYIHLLSGQDLPLKSREEIHEFFSRQPLGSNFVEISDSEENSRNLKNKIDYYYLFTKYQRPKDTGVLPNTKLLLAKIARHAWLRCQKLVGYKRKWKYPEMARGSNWVSISPEFAKYLVDRKKEILRDFKGVLIPDEIYKQTLIINSPFNASVKAFSRGNSRGIRLIDWAKGNGKGSPGVWTMKDLHELKDAYEIFARKFSSSIDKEVILALESIIKSRP